MLRFHSALRYVDSETGASQGFQSRHLLMCRMKYVVTKRSHIHGVSQNSSNSTETGLKDHQLLLFGGFDDCVVSAAVTPLTAGSEAAFLRSRLFSISNTLFVIASASDTVPLEKDTSDFISVR